MSLLDEMDIDIVAYRPDTAGDAVEGDVVALDVTSSEFTTDPIPVITLKTDEGVYRGVRGYHTTLRNELEKLNLQVGDRLAIQYEGKKKTKDGKRTFHAYKVRRAVAAPASSQGDAAEDEPPF